MPWRKRYLHRLLKPVAGFLLALLVLEAVQTLPYVNLFLAWDTLAEAAYNTIQPDGDGSTAAAATTCGGGGNFDCLDDGVATSSTPSTAGDYLTFADGDQDYYTMTTLSSVDTVSTIYFPVYHRETKNNMTLSVSLWDVTETTQYGTTQNLTYQSSSNWDTANFTGLSLTQTQLSGLRVRLSCARSGGKPSECIAYSGFGAVAYTEQIDITVGATGNQQNLKIGTTTAHVGAAFSIKENTSSRNVTAITITENGSVDAQNDLDNIELYYELDTTGADGYDCSSESYNGTESKFGSTDTDGFSGADGTSAFSGTSVGISTTQSMCVYVVLDVLDTATFGETIQIEISDPTSDITASGPPIISPATAVLLPNTTTLEEAIITQENYHWRNDDGDETNTGATSATGGTENSSFDTLPKAQTKRLRFAVSNEGNVTSTAYQMRLEYATKTASCADPATWVNVGDTGGAFDMFDTGNLTNGDDTTSGVTVANGGVSDPNVTFLTPNGGIRDTTSQTGNITLTSTEFVELEYAIRASASVPDGTTYCFRISNAGTELDAYTNYAEATISADISVTDIGTQTTTVTIPTTGQYAGGAFVIKGLAASTFAVTSITITATGTDVINDVENIKLRYDLDTTSLYDCGSVSYASGDTPYGSTVGSFNGSYQATFTGSVNVNQTQSMCVYIEYDLKSSANNGATFEVSIDDPSTEVVAGAASVSPTAPVNISGTTQFAKQYLEQSDYHWRNNDGNEAGASSATGGTENTAYVEFEKNTTKRIRFAVGNTGLAASAGETYRLEWAQKISTCEAASGWARVDTAADEWSMSPTANLTDGGNTSDVAVANGGVSNPATTWDGTNGGQKDTNDTTASQVLAADNYFDLEYSIQANTSATQGATYCFRVTDAGTPLDLYTNYPEATIKLDTDYKIQRGVSTMTGSTITINAGADYDAPSSASNAFIRITNTQLTGAGPNTGNSSNNADDVTAYISNPGNITSSITFQRSATAAGNTRISWEIIEYTGVSGGENEMIVRRQEAVSYGAGNTTLSGTVTNTVVTDAQVAVFITAQYNADAGRNAYHEGLSTAAWNTTNNQADFTRGASGAVSTVSYALVEFTGANWKVQRSEHTYTNTGTVETNSITAVNSLSRTFLHVQKRTNQNDHAEIGHEVWLSGIGQISFLLDAAATTPGSHVSVAWVIENTQTQGVVMVVTRSNGGFATSGTGPQTNNVNIGKTINDLTITSLFVNNRSDEVQRSFPEPIMSARIISATQYELWRSDSSANVNYRTAVVEWPTAARKLEQNYYRIYVDNDALKPTDPWPAGVTNIGENAEMTALDEPMASGDTARVRMTLLVTSAAMPATLDSFKLQFAKQGASCMTATGWLDVGEIGSTTAAWRGVNNTPADGTQLSIDPPTPGDLLISVATVAGTYEEENLTSVNPHTAFPNDEIEFDWTLQHNGADDKTSYCFRMTEADGSELEDYHFYPVLRTVGYGPVVSNWRWYDDETNLTPSTPLANQNVAPIDVANENIIKLRVTLEEASGAAGVDNKFEVQYSEYSDFSQSVFTLSSSTLCAADSIWCYADGNGVDNALVDGTVISDADSCVSGVGAGCGTHNESTSTVGATFDQAAFTTAEFEFTLQHAGARANAVYYFRFYDVTTGEFVPLGGAATYPSLVTEGAQMVSTLTGVTTGTTVAGVTSDVETTPTSIGFGSIPFGTSYEAIQSLSVDTNATEGYQLLMYTDQQLTNTYGDIIPPITSTNALPASWLSACSGAASGCFGYHTTDATLENGPDSGRFAPIDSYAALDTLPQEIMYSSIPANDEQYIVYRIQIDENQTAGDYQSSIVYITVPVH